MTFLARLAAIDDLVAYQAQLCMDAGDPAKAAACDNTRTGIAIARNTYLLATNQEDDQ